MSYSRIREDTMRPPGSPKTLEQRRAQAIRLLQDGLMPVDVAKRLGVDRRSVRRWRASYEHAGAQGIQRRPAPGRPPKLDAQAQADLEADLLRGARAHGFPTNLWTCPRIARVIWRNYRVRYHVDHIGRLLRSLGWTPQKPERRARERDEAAIQGWIKRDWVTVKKTPRG
jgi:transposase